MNQKTLLRDNMPQFGAEHIVEDEVLGGPKWIDPESGFGFAPPIRANYAAWPMTEVKIDPNTPVCAFTSSETAALWEMFNCDRCKRKSCALRDRLDIAKYESSTIPFKAAKRIGCVVKVGGHGVFVQLKTTCNEKL